VAMPGVFLGYLFRMSPSRRDFLKSAPAAAGALSLVSELQKPAAPAAKPVHTKIGDAAYTPVRDYPIQPHTHVTLMDNFWKPRVERNARVTIPFEVEKLTTGDREFRGGVLEAAIVSLESYPDPALQAALEKHVVSARQPNGNSGFEVAATYFNTTGRRELLEPSLKAADALYDNFVRNDPPFSGGERDAINCVQLYRVTHDKKHLDLAKHYLDIRGRADSVNRSRHNQSYKPVLAQNEAVGHAVNCATLMVSLADVGVLTGIRSYFNAAERMWRDAVEKKTYITGGIGTTGNEGFGEPYSLPNISAYSETCAVLMFMTLNQRLFMATGDSKYIDVMERGMYNNAIDGVSAAGKQFFYVNRLASAGDGRDARWEHASLECCPPNLVRFLATMPSFIYAQNAAGAVYVNLYVASDATFTIGGKRLALSVTSGMPSGGTSVITVTNDQAVTGTIKLRIPGWARNRPMPGGLYAYTAPLTGRVAITINGTPYASAPDPMGYVSITRAWKAGDVIGVDLPVEPRRVVADSRVRDTKGRVAIERGPIVHCAEFPECEGGRALNVRLDPAAPLTAEIDSTLFGGVTVIRTEARSMTNPAAPAKRLTLIPYSAWANRGVGEMTVWLPTKEYEPGDIGPAGGWIFYTNPNYAKDGWRYLEAAPFDQSAGATWGAFRKLIPGSRGTAIGTGKQNTTDMIIGGVERGSAADLCAHLKVNGVSGWFLPSRDELALMYRNLEAAGLGDFRAGGVADNFSYWASSQQTADMSAHIDFADLGRQHGDDKDFPRRVRAIRQI
jgi:DUF1680 family protein